LIFLCCVFALSATTFFLPEEKVGKKTGHRITFLSKSFIAFITQRLLLAIHGQNEPNPNILFGFAKSNEGFGKVQRWGSCSHIDEGLLGALALACLFLIFTLVESI